MPYATRSYTRNYVKSYVDRNMETKHKDAPISTTLLSPTGVIVDVTAISQGVGDQQRVADAIQPQRLTYMGQIKGNNNGGVNTDEFNIARLTIIQWHPKVDNVVTFDPLVSDIYLYNSTAINIVNSPFQWDTRDQFTVLHDQRWTLANYYEFSDNFVHNFDIVVFPKGEVRYLAGSTNNASDKIFIIWTSDSSANPSPNVESIYQLTYKDG